MSRDRRARHDRNPLGRGALRQPRAHHAPHGARTSHATRSSAAKSASDDPLIQHLRQALREDDPTAFWITTAPFITEIADLRHHPEELPDGIDLLETFIDVDVAETTALLHMIAAMSPDEDLRSRAQAAVARRRQPMPPHISGLAQAQVTDASAFRDADGENLMVEIVLPRGVRAVLIAYIAWEPVPWVKDAFVVPESMDRVLVKYREIMARDGLSLDEVLEVVPLAGARARFDQALAGAPEDPESSGDGEQWPMLRPFVEFVVGRMPDGGRGYEVVDLDGSTVGLPRDAWILEDGTDLVDEFLRSDPGAGLAEDPGVGDMAAGVMTMLAATFGDPLIWDRSNAAWLLEECLPGAPVLTREAVALIPCALAPLVAWSLERSDADPAEIAEVLDIVRPLAEVFPDLWADPHMLARRLETSAEIALISGSPVEVELADLSLRVGGIVALADLDTTPLPAEDLDLTAIADDLHPLAAEVDAHLVEGVAALLGSTPLMLLADELLTACRRFLVRIARLDDSVLRRKASPRNTAAAILSIVARGNDLMGYAPAPFHADDLKRALTLRSLPSQRSSSLAEAAALPHRYTGIALADPNLLTGPMRASIIAKREKCVEEEW